MTKHGDTIRALAESSVVGPRFKDFIARWEMNIEPPPVERVDKYVNTRSMPPSTLTHGCRTPMGTPQRWGQGRLPDTLEEDYFNREDDDDETIPIVSTPPPKGMVKRKRLRAGLPVPARGASKPFNGLIRTPPLGSLVDYGDDDLGGSDENIVPTPGRASPIPGGFIPIPYVSPPDAPPASPRLSHRQVSIRSPLSPDHDGDILEELSKGGASLLPRISGMSDVGIGSKRRRDDDDDELLERLANKAKRPTPGPSSPTTDTDLPGPAKAGPQKTAEEGPKKLKLRFGAVGAAVASSPSISPSRTGTKDGDNG